MPLLELQHTGSDASPGMKVYLSFDCSKLPHEKIVAAELTLAPLQGYSSWLAFNVFGVADDSRGLDVYWTNPSADQELDWSNAPANDMTKTGGSYQVSEVPIGSVSEGGPRTELKSMILQNGGILDDSAEYLGQIRVHPGDNRTRLLDDRLAEFLNKDRNRRVTLILTLATPAPKVVQFASREHLLLQPPSLWLKTQPEESTFASIRRLAEFEVRSGSGTKRLDEIFVEVGLKARRDGWASCTAEMKSVMQILAADHGADSPESISRLATSLSGLLHLEVAFRGGDLDEDQWAQRTAEIISVHRVQADLLLSAFYFLASNRPTSTSNQGGETFDVRPLLAHQLPAAGRLSLLEFLVDVLLPRDHGAFVEQYRQLVLPRQTQPAAGYLLYRYVLELERTEKAVHLHILLFQIAELFRGSLLGDTAEVLLVSREGDPARQAALIADLIRDARPSGPNRYLLPHHLSHASRNGQLLETLHTLVLSAGTAKAEILGMDPRSFVRMLREVEAAATSPPFLPRMELEKLRLDRPIRVFPMSIALAREQYDIGRFGFASSITEAALEAEGIDPASLVWLADDERGKQATDADGDAFQHAGAALLLSEGYRQLRQPEEMQRMLDDAVSAPVDGILRASVLLRLALGFAEAADFEAAGASYQEATAAAPDHPASADMLKLLSMHSGG